MKRLPTGGSSICFASVLHISKNYQVRKWKLAKERRKHILVRKWARWSSTYERSPRERECLYVFHRFFSSLYYSLHYSNDVQYYLVSVLRSRFSMTERRSSKASMDYLETRSLTSELSCQEMLQSPPWGDTQRCSFRNSNQDIGKRPLTLDSSDMKRQKDWFEMFI